MVAEKPMKYFTQKELFFYKLYVAFKEDPTRWVPAWEFVGEILVKETGKWALMSYKTPANGAGIFFDNPGLIERQRVTGRSGAKYFAYRIAPFPSESKMKDDKLLAFYRKIKRT